MTPDEAPRARGRFNSRTLLAGAAVGLGLSAFGLGMANARIDSSTTTRPPSEAPSADAAGGCRGRHGPGGHHPGKAGLGVAATAIGISESDLLGSLRSGQSIAQVAEAKGVAVDKVVDALVADAKKRISEKVTAGHLTQAQADQKQATLEERIRARVERPGLGRGGRGPRPGASSTSATPTHA